MAPNSESFACMEVRVWWCTSLYLLPSVASYLGMLLLLSDSPASFWLRVPRLDQVVREIHVFLSVGYLASGIGLSTLDGNSASICAQCWHFEVTKILGVKDLDGMRWG